MRGGGRARVTNKKQKKTIQKISSAIFFSCVDLLRGVSRRRSQSFAPRSLRIGPFLSSRLRVQRRSTSLSHPVREWREARRTGWGTAASQVKDRSMAAAATTTRLVARLRLRPRNHHTRLLHRRRQTTRRSLRGSAPRRCSPRRAAPRRPLAPLPCRRGPIRAPLGDPLGTPRLLLAPLRERQQGPGGIRPLVPPSPPLPSPLLLLFLSARSQQRTLRWQQRRRRPR